LTEAIRKDKYIYEKDNPYRKDHHVFLDFHSKTFTCLDEDGKYNTVKGVPRPISKREI
jgi:hypothetical protein